MKPNVYHRAMMGICIALLAGCLNLGPDYSPPDLGIRYPATYQNAAAGDSVQPEIEHWWRTFSDPELDALVEEALRYNWDVKAAAARVLEARAQFVQVRAERFPEINASGSAERRRIPVSGQIPATTVNSFQLATPASFEIDLWGRLGKAARAAWDDILKEEESRRALAQSVAAETVSLYLQLEAVERQLQIIAQSIDAFRRSLQFVQIRYNRGLTSALDVRQARRLLAQAEARVPQLEQNLALFQLRLARLLGRYPQTRPPRAQPDEYYQQLPPVPAGLPSELLLRRPDIRAAEARLMAANARIGIAKANRFPRIDLTGAFGWSSDDLGSLLGHDNYIWRTTGGILYPLFDAGRLKAAQRSSEARYEQVVADYANTVLEALREVEAALFTRRKQIERRQRVVTFLEEARATQRVAQNRYIRGLSSYLDVLDAQQTRFQAEENLVLVDLAILNNRVALHRALGGSWAEPGPVEDQDFRPYYRF
jgi:multidrug efflux system outer membrane protein